MNKSILTTKRRWPFVVLFLPIVMVRQMKLHSGAISLQIRSETPSRENFNKGEAVKFQTERRDFIGSFLAGTGNDERRILIGGDHCLDYSLTGTIFQEGRTIPQEHKVKMCHLKTFGKDLEEECQKEFMDMENNVKVMLKSPSLLWRKDELVISLRLNILKRPKSSADCYGFACNHMYLGKYDKYLKPTGDKQITTMRSPFQVNRRSGPDDGRLFHMNNSLYNLFSVGYASYGAENVVTHLISAIWDYQRQKHFIPDFQKDLMRQARTFEKNWMPMVIKDELYIVRNLDPLQIMKCKIYGNCTFVQSDTDPLTFKMDDRASPLRGGTALELYKYPYYVGIVHSTVYHSKKKEKYYAAHLVVLSVKPYRIVYLSDSLQISPDLYSKFSGERVWKNVKGNFIFPTGILFESEDSVVIGAHVNDLASFLLRLEGIKEIISDVMRLDKDKTYQPSALLFQKFLLQRAKDLNITGES